MPGVGLHGLHPGTSSMPDVDDRGDEILECALRGFRGALGVERMP